MKFVVKKRVLTITYVALFVLLEIYAFSHSKQASLALAVLMVFGPLLVFYVRGRQSSDTDKSWRHFRLVIIIMFAAAALLFAYNAFLVVGPENQVLIVVLPLALAIVAGFAQRVDEVSKDRKRSDSRR